LREEILRLRERDALLEIPWQHGLDPDHGRRTARFRVDESGGTVEVFVGRARRPMATLPLAEYRDAVAMLHRDATGNKRFLRLHRDGKSYRQAFGCQNSAITYSLYPS
jgi:hypothetical protein